MYYHEQGLGSVEADFWGKVRTLGDMALAEIEDAADGIFGKNVNEKQLAWVKKAKKNLDRAVTNKDPTMVKALQRDTKTAFADLPTALSSRVTPFTGLAIPKQVEAAARKKMEEALATAAASGSDTDSAGGGSNVLGLALIGIAAAIFLATRK